MLKFNFYSGLNQLYFLGYLIILEGKFIMTVSLNTRKSNPADSLKITENIHNGYVFYTPVRSMPNDNIKIRSYYGAENERLEKSYGIKSAISNPAILKQVSAAIEDFCIINQNHNLFNGLVINEKPLKNAVFGFSADDETKKFELSFNSNFDWDSIADYTNSK